MVQSNKVQLYVYDLSRGMAKSMSLALTGKQLDGIWHTSIVVFGREIFYGRGIMEAYPGRTHHGTPVQIIDCGETHIDPDTFQEYLMSLSELYTASAYHLMNFNCNNFTADLAGFLTGAEIPAWITGLPSEFLATPLGQALRPQIDAMFSSTSSSEHSAFEPVRADATPPPPPAAVQQPPQVTPDLAAAFLSAIAGQAAGGGMGGMNGAGPSAPKSNPTTTALTLVSSSANFTSTLKQNRAVVVNFTNTAGCPPCRAIKPAYESISETYAQQFGPKGARFVEVELGVGEGQDIASKYGVTATPTFMFFRDGKKVDELRGADKKSLEGKVEAFMDECFPQHPHKRFYLPVTERLSTQPITATAKPAFPALIGKLESFNASAQHVNVLKNEVVPFLEGKANPNDAQLGQLVDKWTVSTTDLLGTLKPAECFPLVDLWRIGLLDNRVVTTLLLRLSPAASGPQALGPILSVVVETLKSSGTSAPRPLILTALRLSTNLLAPLPLANLVLTPGSSLQPDLLTTLIESLLHPEASVRKAAADVAVNAAAWRHRVAKERAAAEGQQGEEEDTQPVEWETELLAALLTSIAQEEDADVGHRLLVASALLIYLAPDFDGSVKPLLEALDARDTFTTAGKRWGNKDARKLAEEVASKLC